MRKIMLLSVCCLLAAFGCSRPPAQNDAVVKIGNYTMTLGEFTRRFQESSYALRPTKDAENDFLQDFINQRLILLEAQKKGLDKQNDFLESVERYWEQALLKVAVEDKNRDFVGKVQVSEKDIHDRYIELLTGRKIAGDAVLESVYSQIEWQLKREKEAALMSNWVDSLKQEFPVEVNNGILNQWNGGSHE